MICRSFLTYLVESPTLADIAPVVGIGHRIGPVGLQLPPNAIIGVPSTDLLGRPHQPIRIEQTRRFHQSHQRDHASVQYQQSLAIVLQHRVRSFIRPSLPTDENPGLTGLFDLDFVGLSSLSSITLSFVNKSSRRSSIRCSHCRRKCQHGTAKEGEALRAVSLASSSWIELKLASGVVGTRDGSMMVWLRRHS